LIYSVLARLSVLADVRAFRPAFAMYAPHDTIPVWAIPLAFQVLLRPSQP
jgi:hypothetical protein